MDQYALGWSNVWDHYWETYGIERFVRICQRQKNAYRAIDCRGQPLSCALSGRFLHERDDCAELPSVGDWCLIGDSFHQDVSNNRAALLEEVLPRRSRIARAAAGTSTLEQVLAANVDYLFITTSCNSEFNINRLQRYLIMAVNGGSQPVIVLTKTDLCAAVPNDYIEQILAAADQLQIPFICTSSLDGSGLDSLTDTLASGQTGVFVGSSGVGKSTLVNALLQNEVQNTFAIRVDDQRGRHTTSSAGLFFMPNGGMLIDTPGLRELLLIADHSDLDAVMPELHSLARQCKFNDCRHDGEPGCAVQAALALGVLQQGELNNYEKLEKEIAYTKRKFDRRAAAQEKQRWKQIAKDNRKRTRNG